MLSWNYLYEHIRLSIRFKFDVRLHLYDRCSIYTKATTSSENLLKSYIEKSSYSRSKRPRFIEQITLLIFCDTIWLFISPYRMHTYSLPLSTVPPRDLVISSKYKTTPNENVFNTKEISSYPNASFLEQTTKKQQKYD